MSVDTRPFRVINDDLTALRFIAEIEQHSPQNVFHDALALYMQVNRDRLTKLFDQTKRAIADGDVDALAKQLSASADERGALLAATLPSLD